jgi:hypothetical protein
MMLVLNNKRMLMFLNASTQQQEEGDDASTQQQEATPLQRPSPQFPSGTTFNPRTVTCEAEPTCPQDYTPVNGQCEKIVPVEKVCPADSRPSTTSPTGCEKTLTQPPTICPSGTTLNAGTCESRPGCNSRTTSSGTTVGSIQRNPNCIRS